VTPLIGLLGRWGDRGIPTGGLVFFLSPPVGLWDALIENPFRTVFFAACAFSASAVISKAWIEVANAGPLDVARQLREQGLAILTLRENAGAARLRRYIPLAATFGAVAVCAVSILGDALGVIGGRRWVSRRHRCASPLRWSLPFLRRRVLAAVLVAVALIFDLSRARHARPAGRGGLPGPHAAGWVERSTVEVWGPRRRCCLASPLGSYGGSRSLRWPRFF